MSARAVAARVLVRVFQDQAYAAAALSTELNRARLEARDRGLATELTYGVLRTEKHLRRRLSAFGKIKESDHVLSAHLLIAAYQIDFLDRVPARAAVNEAVKLIGEARDSRISGFANAILRRVASEESSAKLPLREAVLASTPAWLRKRLVRSLGQEASDALLCPTEAPAPVLRVTRFEVSDSLKAFLNEQCEAIASVPLAYRFGFGGDPRAREEFQAGHFVLQELGAQLVAHALGARAGETILDVCAGRGQKTALLALQVGTSGKVTATDLHEHKVSALKEEMARVGVDVFAQTWDFTSPPPEQWHFAFDRVLVDAPCSGTGTLARRPEILRRLGPEDPARLAELQLALLRNAALTVRPGGTLVFATCSALPEEGEEVVRAFLGGSGDDPGAVDFQEISEALAVDPALFPGDAPRTARVRLLPHSHGTDGYFIGRLRRSRAP